MLVQEVHLLTAGQMMRLSPDAEIKRERVGPFVKSLVALRKRKGAAQQSPASGLRAYLAGNRPPIFCLLSLKASIRRHVYDQS